MINNYELWQEFKNDPDIIQGLIERGELVQDEVNKYETISANTTDNSIIASNTEPACNTLDNCRQTKKLKDARHLYKVFKRNGNEPTTRETLYNAVNDLGFQYIGKVRAWCYQPK